MADTTFKQDVAEGLTTHPKHLSSKYFYDERGDLLFQMIMEMPGYYLTRAEFNILQENRESIARHFIGDGSPFDLIELGAGDGKKTKILLRELLERQAPFTYRPVDISGNALQLLESAIEKELPGIQTKGLQTTYSEILTHPDLKNETRKVTLFLGANIGNLLPRQAADFLKRLGQEMQPADLLLVGFDMKKDPEVILNAYNDEGGLTEDFNKNLLLRINRELGGNFDPDLFRHWEVYDPESGTARSYLVAREAHEVYIRDLELQVEFRAWETLHTEISQKYDEPAIQEMARQAGLNITASYSNSGKSYKNYLFSCMDQ